MPSSSLVDVDGEVGVEVGGVGVGLIFSVVSYFFGWVGWLDQDGNKANTQPEVELS